jgi:glutamate-1-semialdehyde 2,1-aminomutase/spore coat polysaccharide biosynthesis protein SpsF
MGSTRLPGKVLKTLGVKPLMSWTLDACFNARLVDQVVLATSTLPADDAIEEYCIGHGIPCFRGDSEDVLSRFYLAALRYNADIVLRFTCDCPFIDPRVIDEVIKLREMTHADYASNCYPPTYPDGLDTECFTMEALEAAYVEAENKIDRECQTQFIVRNRNRFKVVNLTCPLPGLDREHWVCDSPEDFEFCDQLVRHMRIAAHAPYTREPVNYTEILEILRKNPELRKINDKSIRNERFYEALAVEPLSPRTFERSQRVFQRSEGTIPLASQTVSKSYLQFPQGCSPLAASHGDGGYIFDVDGNRYVDLVGALGPVVLGCGDPDVNEAIRRQLDDGISFSLPTVLEGELAELLCQIIPCAEMVKFGKSGTDVTTAAIKCARAFTGRSHILTAGYHGWADWSMCRTDRNLGIPPMFKSFTHPIEYGNRNQFMERLDTLPNQIAAVIVEPHSDPGYLTLLRERCDHHGIVLIFDEILTGFRYAMGGAQEMFHVTPHLACFGKAMANGMPISALVGAKNIMDQFNNPKLHYSGTFFGDALSIAAAIATIKKIQEKNVIDHIKVAGIHLNREICSASATHGLDDEIKLFGMEAHSELRFKDGRVRSLFMREMAQQGVLIINRHMLSYAHKKPEIDRIVTAYHHTLEQIRGALDDGWIEKIDPIAAPPLRAA